MKKSGMFVLSLILLLGVSIFVSASTFQVCSASNACDSRDTICQKPTACIIVTNDSWISWSNTPTFRVNFNYSTPGGSNGGSLIVKQASILMAQINVPSYNFMGYTSAYGTLTPGNYSWAMGMDDNDGDCNCCTGTTQVGIIMFSDGQSLTQKHCCNYGACQNGGWTGNLTITQIQDTTTQIPTAWYKDADGDGYGNLTNTISSVSQPVGYVSNSNDCNDADPNYNLVCSCSSESQKIFRLYQTTNSHVSEYNEADYTIPACYDIIFGGIGNGNRNCKSGNSNVIFYKYQDNNSHVSVNQDANYNTPVCYGDLSCHTIDNTSGTATCNNGEVILASLYQQTNSHVSLGNDPNYPFKICCAASNYIDLTKESNRYWADSISGSNISSTLNGTYVNITVGGNFSAGQKFDYQIFIPKTFLWIFPNDLLVASGSHIISANEAIQNKSSETSWLAIWNETTNANAKYFFRIITPTITKDSGLLEVSKETANIPTKTNITSPKDRQVYLLNDNISLSWNILEQHYPIKKIEYVFGETVRVNGTNSNEINFTGSQDYLLNLDLNASYLTSGEKNITLYTTDANNNVWESRAMILVCSDGLCPFAYISKPQHLTDVSSPKGRVQFSANGTYVINKAGNLMSCVLGDCPLQTSGDNPVSINPLSDNLLKSLKSQLAAFNWTWNNSNLNIYGNGTGINITDFQLIQAPSEERKVNLQFNYLNSFAKVSNQYDLFWTGINCIDYKMQQYTDNSNGRTLTILSTNQYNCSIYGCCGLNEECNFATSQCQNATIDLNVTRTKCPDFNKSKDDCQINTLNKGIANYTFYTQKGYSLGDVINQTPQTSCVETVEGSCIWQDNSCNLNWGGVWNSDSCSPQDGNCTLKNETISGSCEKEGLLTYSWNATWAGNNVNGLKAQCTEGYTRIPCAAQLKLPFFGAISFVMVLGIIALVYFFRRK